MQHKTSSGKPRPWALLRHFPFTALCVVLTWYLCLIKPPSLSIPLFSGFDKCVHITMYLGTCSVFWVEYYRRRSPWPPGRLALVAVAAPILMSGLIELAQEYLTTTRSGDWLDLAANSTGVVLALLLSPLFRVVVRRFGSRRSR